MIIIIATNHNNNNNDSNNNDNQQPPTAMNVDHLDSTASVIIGTAIIESTDDNDLEANNTPPKPVQSTNVVDNSMDNNMTFGLPQLQHKIKETSDQ